jgi:hypothetical protein
VPRLEPVARVARFLVALVALGACDGGTLHLGNGRDGGGTGGTCIHGQVAANEVLWIGDGWVTIPGSQITRLQELSGATYVNAAAAGASLSAIVAQYAAQEAGTTKPKVLLMDGGTIDTFGGADPTKVADMFSQFLTKVASDGSVEKIVYFIPPQLDTIAGVKELNPLVMMACALSAVPCYFLDLDPIWMDSYTDMSSGYLPNEAGGRALADAIWMLMQQYCIAQ